MRLYLVIRWGNDHSLDKANGEDTSFLVRASDHNLAATLVDQALPHLPHENIACYSNVVVEIGNDRMSGSQPAIMMGPWYQWSNFGGMLDYPSWIRNYEDEGWTKGTDYLAS